MSRDYQGNRADPLPVLPRMLLARCMDSPRDFLKTTRDEMAWTVKSNFIYLDFQVSKHRWLFSAISAVLLSAGLSFVFFLHFLHLSCHFSVVHLVVIACAVDICILFQQLLEFWNVSKLSVTPSSYVCKSRHSLNVGDFSSALKRNETKHKRTLKTLTGLLRTRFYVELQCFWLLVGVVHRP